MASTRRLSTKRAMSIATPTVIGLSLMYAACAEADEPIPEPVGVSEQAVATLTTGVDINNTWGSMSSVPITCTPQVVLGAPVFWYLHVLVHGQDFATFGSIPLAVSAMLVSVSTAAASTYYNEVSTFQAKCDAAGGTPGVQLDTETATVFVTYSTPVTATLLGAAFKAGTLSCPCKPTGSTGSDGGITDGGITDGGITDGG